MGVHALNPRGRGLLRPRPLSLDELCWNQREFATRSTCSM